MVDVRAYVSLKKKWYGWEVSVNPSDDFPRRFLTLRGAERYLRKVWKCL